MTPSDPQFAEPARSHSRISFGGQEVREFAIPKREQPPPAQANWGSLYSWQEDAGGVGGAVQFTALSAQLHSGGRKAVLPLRRPSTPLVPVRRSTTVALCPSFFVGLVLLSWCSFHCTCCLGSGE